MHCDTALKQSAVTISECQPNTNTGPVHICTQLQGDQHFSDDELGQNFFMFGPTIEAPDPEYEGNINFQNIISQLHPLTNTA
jgi:hypothetical protein